MSCDKSLVGKTFEVILGADYIENIHESNNKDSIGKPHKTYKVTFKENTPGLEDISERITLEGFIKIAYKLEWDRTTRKYVERYWKVYNYNSPQASFKPHIMESHVLLTDDQDTAKDFNDLAKAIAHFGEDYPGCIANKIPKPPSEYTHLSEYIANVNRWKQKAEQSQLKCSDDPEEEIVWKCDQMYDAESEEWNELKAALEVFSGEPVTFVREIPPISEWEKTPPKPPILRRATALQSEEVLWGIPQGPSHIEQIWGEQVPPPPEYTRAENTLHNIY